MDEPYTSFRKVRQLGGGLGVLFRKHECQMLGIRENDILHFTTNKIEHFVMDEVLKDEQGWVKPLSIHPPFHCNSTDFDILISVGEFRNKDRKYEIFIGWKSTKKYLLRRFL